MTTTEELANRAHEVLEAVMSPPPMTEARAALNEAGLVD